jgi:hypothetical protein
VYAFGLADHFVAVLSLAVLSLLSGYLLSAQCLLARIPTVAVSSLPPAFPV